MKINNELINKTQTQTQQPKSAVGQAAAPSEFKGVLKTARLDGFNIGMKELISIVKERGERFVRAPHEEALNSYKESVKVFFNRIKEEYLSLKEEFGSPRNGEQKLYQLVSSSEAEIKGLTREAFSENKALNLLSSLDDIRGLVIDIIG